MSKFSDIVEKIPGVLELEEWFEHEEQLIIAEFEPLIAQIIEAIKSLGKDTFEEGLQVFKDAAKAAVEAGAAAASQGVEAVVSSAENAFLTVGASEGITAIRNAEAGFIKAAVAIVQGTSTTSTEG